MKYDYFEYKAEKDGKVIYSFSLKFEQGPKIKEEKAAALDLLRKATADMAREVL